MKIYKLENNHRSSKQIISLLNYIRNDNNFIQVNPNGESGEKPILLIGDPIGAYHYFINEFESKELDK